MPGAERFLKSLDVPAFVRDDSFLHAQVKPVEFKELNAVRPPGSTVGRDELVGAIQNDVGHFSRSTRKDG